METAAAMTLETRAALLHRVWSEAVVAEVIAFHFFPLLTAEVGPQVASFPRQRDPFWCKNQDQDISEWASISVEMWQSESWNTAFTGWVLCIEFHMNREHVRITVLNSLQMMNVKLRSEITVFHALGGLLHT